MWCSVALLIIRQSSEAPLINDAAEHPEVPENLPPISVMLLSTLKYQGICPEVPKDFTSDLCRVYAKVQK